MAAVGIFPVDFGNTDPTARMAHATSHNIVDGTPIHVAIEAWEEFFVNRHPVDGFVGEGSRKGLVMGHSVLLHDLSKFIDGGLGDASMRGNFCVWDGVRKVGGVVGAPNRG